MSGFVGSALWTIEVMVREWRGPGFPATVDVAPDVFDAMQIEAAHLELEQGFRSSMRSHVDRPRPLPTLMVRVVYDKPPGYIQLGC